MDELDRLYRRLVHNIRAVAPDLLGRPFEISEIYQQLVPYRTNRVALGYTANDEYELALCQLVAGSRGLLTGDAEMQKSLRRELDSANPDLASYRVFSTSPVSLAPEPLRELMLHPTPEHISAVSHSSNSSPSAQISLASRPTLAVDTPAHDAEKATGDRPTQPMPKAPPVREAQSPALAPRGSSPSLPAPLEHSMPVARPNPVHANPGEKCRYCGGKLPDGRSLIFCPGCGHNLTIKHCAACNTELEVEWKFCVTCGRESNG